MRRLLLLACLCLLAQSAGAQAIVRLCPASATLNGGNNAGTTVTCIFASNAAGNMNFVWGMVDQNSAALTIADTVGTSELFFGIAAGGDGAVTLSAGTNVAWVMQQKTINGNRSPGWESFVASSTQTVSANFTYSANTGSRVIIATFQTPVAVVGGSKKKKVYY